MPRPRKYPWESWLDGEPHTLKQGEDFDASVGVSSLATQIRNRARLEELTVSVSAPDPRTIVIQPAASAERYSRYPWALWLDGAEHVITFDEISCQPHSLRQYVYAVARDRGKAVRFNLDYKRQMIKIQAIGPYRPRRSIASYEPHIPLRVFTTEELQAQLRGESVEVPFVAAPAPGVADFNSFDPSTHDEEAAWISEERPS
jgi:hypothetical protein